MVRSLPILAALSLSLLACEPVPPAGSGSGSESESDPESESESDSVSDSDSDPESETEPDPEAEPDPETEPDPEAEPDPETEPEPEPEPVPFARFVALGDAGKGNNGQYLVADAIQEVCAERGGCDFALMLGDNVYDTGVDDIDDEQWQEKFELPYAELDFPFYVTLGNHDYGAPPVLSFLGGVGIDPRRGEAQVDYGNGVSSKFVMPASHYRIDENPVELVSLNTTSLFWADMSSIESLTGFDDENDLLVENLGAWAADPLAPWRVAFGHHPFRSNGPHGNAGEYDGVFLDGLIGSGTALEAFFEDHVIGQFDVYLCGHDHSLQDLGEVDGTELIVSGGGASHTDLDGENVPLWQADRRGFVLIEADPTEMRFVFVVVPDDEDGVAEPWSIDHERVITQ